MRKLLLLRCVVVCLAASLFALSVRAQNPADEAQIRGLIDRLENHPISPGSAHDPELTGKARAKNVDALSDQNYQLTVTPKSDFVFTSDGTARVTAEIHFSDSTTSEMSNTDASIYFVKRQGVWYFANYSFLGTPIWFWPLVIIMGGFAITIAVVMLRHLRRIREARRARQPGGA
jgi:hypothetical protein